MYAHLPPRQDPREDGDGAVEDEIDGEEGKWREAEDFEMRDVRRDGLIEALLIAFTPPRGLPYPRVYPPSLNGSAEAVSGERRASIFLPLRRPSSTRPPSSLPSPSSSQLASRHAFHLHLMQRCSRCLFSSLPLSLSFLSFPSFPLFLPRDYERSFLLFHRSKPPRHYINALIGIVARSKTLSARREEASERVKDEKGRKDRGERERETETREVGETRITGIICPPARATISPDPPAISRSPPAPSCTSSRSSAVRLVRRPRTTEHIVYRGPTTMTRCSISPRIDHRTKRPFFAPVE